MELQDKYKIVCFCWDSYGIAGHMFGLEVMIGYDGKG